MYRLFLIFLFPVLLNSLDYKTIFRNDYDNALQFMSDNYNLFLEYSSLYNTDPEIIMSVLFPEAIRYSIIRDYLETKSLELAYVYAGTADFSIGYFQMKPSFAESIEQMVREKGKMLDKYDSLLIPEEKSMLEIRKTRIERLRKLEYQVVYANCLYDIIRLEYPEIFYSDKAHQIRFISTAYNHGFLCGQEEILDYASKAFFPMNGKNKTDKFVYHEISLYFFYNDFPGIVSRNQNYSSLE